MSMSPQDIQQLLAQIARIKGGGYGPNMPPPQIPQQEAIIPEQVPDSMGPLAPPVDNAPPARLPQMPPMQPPRGVATPDDVRMNQLNAILDARNNPQPAPQPHGFGQKLLQNWLQPIAQGFAYGKDAPMVVNAQRQQQLQNRQDDTRNLMAQIQQIQQRKQQEAEMARNQGIDARAQAESDRNAQLFPLQQTNLENQNATEAAKLKQLNDPKFTIIPNDATYGDVTPGTAKLNVQGQSPKTVVPKTDTEFDQQLAAFNADPQLVAKYGKGPIGFGRYQQDQQVERAKASRPPEPDMVVSYSENGVNGIGRLPRGGAQLQPIQTPGGGVAGPKLAEPPVAVKTQGSAAMTALKQVDNIQKIISENPQLIGPMAGRFQEFMQGVGSNPFVGTKDEQLGAQLAEHMNALFAQELRSMFPGRTNEQMQELIRSTSAQMKQNPNMIAGFLEGIRRNENMVLETARQQGFKEDIGIGASGGTAPREQFSPSTGKYRYSIDGGKTWIDGRAPKQ